MASKRGRTITSFGQLFGTISGATVPTVFPVITWTLRDRELTWRMKERSLTWNLRKRFTTWRMKERDNE